MQIITIVIEFYLMINELFAMIDFPIYQYKWQFDTTILCYHIKSECIFDVIKSSFFQFHAADETDYLKSI